MIKRFLKRLFPPHLVEYTPGAKFLAGVFTALGVAGLQALTNANIDTTVIGITIDQNTITTVAGLLAVYLWPATEVSDIESELASFPEPLGVDVGDNTEL